MKKILSIALGEISTGELSIANSFEKGLDKRKYKIDYLIPKSKIGFFDDGESCRIYTVSREKKAIDNQNYILNLINNNNYDLIILFDVFTLEYGQEWTGVNFEILSSLDIPIASIDEYEYTKAGYKLDYYGMFVKRLPGLLEKCDYIIKNCPLTMPKSKDNCFQQGKKSNEYYYRVFNNLLKIEDKEKREIREKYIRNEENKKIVFFTTSQWEIEGAYSFSSQNTLTKWILPALYNYLCMLDKEIVLLHVGSTIWENNFHNTKVEYIHHPGLPVDLFEKTLQSADLYVTLNLVSITLSKAIMFGIPSIVLNNKKIIEFSRFTKVLKRKPEWYQNMADEVKKIYPFTASMFGWSHFLKTVMKDNDYIKTFDRVEFFNTRKTTESFNRILFDKDYRKNLQYEVKRFYDKYYKLPTSDKVLDEIFLDMKK